LLSGLAQQPTPVASCRSYSTSGGQRKRAGAHPLRIARRLARARGCADPRVDDIVADHFVNDANRAALARHVTERQMMDVVFTRVNM